MYINIHTHQPPAKGEWALQNRYGNFDTLIKSNHYSLGLHPWYIDNNWLQLFEQLEKHSRQENVLAIGETGLDKICTTDWELQQSVFRKQIQLAIAFQKPIIIHCVKAWNDVVTILGKEKINTPVIFHGFTRSIALAKELTGKGYYLSFGKSLEKETLQQVLRQIPATQFFLETDDADLTIESIYKYAASALSIDMNSLSLQLQKNAAAVFGPSFIL